LGCCCKWFRDLLYRLSEEVWRGWYAALKSKWFPKPPEPVKVDGKFVPSAFEPGKCAWVPEYKAYDHEPRTTRTTLIRIRAESVFESSEKAALSEMSCLWFLQMSRRSMLSNIALHTDRQKWRAGELFRSGVQGKPARCEGMKVSDSEGLARRAEAPQRCSAE
jgi:hypothetical protein